MRYDIDVGRPKEHDFPVYMTVDGRGGYEVRNPITKKKKRYSAEEKEEAEKDAKTLAEWMELRKQQEAAEDPRPKLNELIKLWVEERLPFQPWDEYSRNMAQTRLRRIGRECGNKAIEDVDCAFIDTWLCKTAKKADPFNKWLDIWVLLFNLAVVRKLAVANEAEKIERRSTSRKIASNRKVRRQLDVEGFEAIYGLAPPFLQVAMDLSLVTLLARNEVCEMQHPHFRHGFVFVIRDKTSADSSMAFIKIEVTEEIEAIRGRARTLVAEQLSDSDLDCERAAKMKAAGSTVAQIASALKSTPRKIHQLLWYQRQRGSAKNIAVASPYLVHRVPTRKQKRWMAGKAHWTKIAPAYLSKTFAEIRDKVPRFAALPAKQRPTFHEIRGLGSRLHLQRGQSKKKIKELMAHGNQKTTDIYLERGAQALTDDDYVTVSAPFSRRDLLATGRPGSG